MSSKTKDCCPNCGHCPHCGRSTQPPQPIPYPYPVYPTGPYWQHQPYRITCGSGNISISPQNQATATYAS